MIKAWLVLGAAACVLPAGVLAIWPGMSDYFDFVVSKSCFGEDTAVLLEKMGREVGSKCWMQEWHRLYGLPEERQTRRRRNILKMPSSPTDSLLACNLRGLKLLTDENEMNYDVVDNWLKNLNDTELGEQLLEKSASCKKLQVPIPNLPIDDEISPLIKGVLEFRTYMNCMNAEGTKVCREREMKIVMKQIQLN
ncbi:uncharacterized protein [Cherax quadricarinatus]